MVSVYMIIECDYVEICQAIHPGSDLRPDEDTTREEQVGGLHSLLK
jgi:hypothetical protein